MKKNTKRTLVATLLVMLLSLTVLVGSTFAYFNDEAIVNGSVTTGDLDTAIVYSFVENYDATDAEANMAWKTFPDNSENSTDATGETISISVENYKPGDYTNLWIKFTNDGTLDYTLTFVLTAADDDTNTADLLTQIEYKFSSFVAADVEDVADLNDTGDHADAIPAEGVTYQVVSGAKIAPGETVYACFQIRMDYDAADDGAQNIYQNDSATFVIDIEAKQIAGNYVPYN